MKKGIKNLAIATMVGVASMGLMTGCKKEESKPYIQVSGLDTAYIQNEDINLEGAKILYYSDKNDTSADEINLTESMIANFDTETTGEKKMKVLWNNFELEINYSVISTTDFVNLYNTAYDNLMNAENVHGNVISTYENETVSESMNMLLNVSNNKYYSKMQSNGEIEETWSDKFNEEWFEYYDEEDTEDRKSRRNVSSYINNDNVMENVIGNFLGNTSKMDEEVVSQFESFTVDIENNQIILTVNYRINNEYENETETYKFFIQENKFVKIICNSYDYEGNSQLYSLVSISYNAEDVEMVDLPADANEWELVG